MHGHNAVGCMMILPTFAAQKSNCLTILIKNEKTDVVSTCLEGYVKEKEAFYAELCKQLMADECQRFQKWMANRPEGPQFGIFNPCLDENKLAVCFSEVYAHFYGLLRKDSLEESCDEVTFAAYLYLLVEREGLGHDNFTTRGKQPFYEFVRTKVVSIDKGGRLFQYRLDEMTAFRRKLAGIQPGLKTDAYYADYRKIEKRFAATPYYIGIQRIRESRK